MLINDELPISCSFIQRVLTKALEPVTHELRDIKQNVHHIGSSVEVLEDIHDAINNHSSIQLKIPSFNNLRTKKIRSAVTIYAYEVPNPSLMLFNVSL